MLRLVTTQTSNTCFRRFFFVLLFFFYLDHDCHDDARQFRGEWIWFNRHVHKKQNENDNSKEIKKKQILTAVKWGTQHITTQHNNNVKFSPSDQPFRFILLLIGVIIHVHCRFHAQRMYRFNLIVSVTLINCSVQLLRRVFVDKTEWLSDAHIGLNTQIKCSNVEESCYSRNSPN